MLEDEEKNSQEKSPDSNSPIISPNDEEGNNNSQISNYQEEKSNDSKLELEKNKFIQVGVIDNKNWTRIEKITFWGLVTNGLMFLGTVLAIIVAISANTSADKNFKTSVEYTRKLVEADSILADATKNSVNYSDSIFQINKSNARNIDNNFIASLKVTKQSADAATNSARLTDSAFKISKKGIDISTNGIELSKANMILAQRNFEIQNKAYILISAINVDTIKPNKQCGVGIMVKNFGRTPALVIASINTVDIDTQAVKMVNIFPKENLRYVNIYLSQEMSGFNISSRIPIVNDLQFELVKRDYFKIRFAGQILFRDMVTTKLYSYAYSIRILGDGKFMTNPDNNSVREIVNENEWLHDTK